MTRAAGKHGPRKAAISDEEKAYIGADVQVPGPDRDLPGGRTHVVQKVLPPATKPATTEPKPQFRGMMAHGVEPEGDHWDRPGHDGHARDFTPEMTKPYIPPVPVPVYIVPEDAGGRPLRIAVPRHITVPGFNGDPVLICGRDVNRTKIRLLNSDASNNIRFASDPTSLVVDPGSANSRTIGGALLVKGMTGYQDVETQDELWAITVHATATVELNIIMETSIAGAG